MRKRPADPNIPRVRNRKLHARITRADDKSAMGYEALEVAGELVADLAREIRADRITIELAPEDTTKV